MKSILIEQHVEFARKGENPYVISQMSSGWLVVGDVQAFPGYCIFIADPVATSFNRLSESDRIRYARDVGRIGDTLLDVTGAFSIKYETVGNVERTLHTCFTPRYFNEPFFKRGIVHASAFPRVFSRKFDPAIDGEFMRKMRAALSQGELGRRLSSA